MRGYEAGPADWPVEIVFLHANGLNARAYLNMLSPLAERARLRVLDFRGHGRSDLPLPETPITNFHHNSNDVIAALESQTDAPVILAGHSLGAAVAMLVAGARPDLVRSVVALDPPALPPLIGALTASEFARGIFTRFIPPYVASSKRRTHFKSKSAAVKAYAKRGFFAGWPKQALKDYVEDGFVKDGDQVTLSCPREWEAATYLAHKHDLLGAVRAMKRPLWMSLATHNSPTPPSMVWRIKRIRPDANIKRHTGVGHMFPVTHPGLARLPLYAALDL